MKSARNLAFVVFFAVLTVSLCLKTGNYYYDEGKTGNRCTGELKQWQCDGARTCSAYGWCQGNSAHPTIKPVKNADFKFNEAPLDEKCVNEYMCDGKRTCVRGKCQGKARDDPPPKVKGPKYSFDEGPKGHKCDNDFECDGNRTCSLWHWCQGISRP